MRNAYIDISLTESMGTCMTKFKLYGNSMLMCMVWKWTEGLVNMSALVKFDTERYGKIGRGEAGAGRCGIQGRVKKRSQLFF